MLKLNECLKSKSFFGSDDQNEGNEDPLESDGFVRVTPPLSPVSRHSLLRNTVSQGIFLNQSLIKTKISRIKNQYIQDKDFLKGKKLCLNCDLVRSTFSMTFG